MSEAHRRELVVLVPGVGLGGLELGSLARYLAREGYQTTVFHHPSGYRSLAHSAQALQTCVSRYDAEVVHFVAHSFGGLIILKLFALFPEQKPGRIVCLGTPLGGSAAAKRVLGLPGGRFLLGKGVKESCKSDPMELPAREIGAIAGRLNMLMGYILTPGEPNDTLVCVAETRHPQLTSHQVLPVSHTTMLLSWQVKQHVAAFLQTGTFPV